MDLEYNRLAITEDMNEEQVIDVVTRMRSGHQQSSKIDETDVFKEMMSWLTGEATRLARLGFLISRFKSTNIKTPVLMEYFQNYSFWNQNDHIELWFSNAMDTIHNSALAINISMCGNQVWKIMKKLQDCRPIARSVETRVFLQMVDWLTYELVRLDQFAFLIWKFKASNIEFAVLTEIFRTSRMLNANEDTFLWYKNAVETHWMKTIPEDGIKQFNENVEKVVQDIQQPYLSSTDDFVPARCNWRSS